MQQFDVSLLAHVYEQAVLLTSHLRHTLLVRLASDSLVYNA